jgi:signal transduction histidine kinase
MIGVQQHVKSQVGGWAEAGRRFADTRSAPAVTATLLALAAVTEASARAALTGLEAQTAIVLVLLALATTLPPAALGVPASAIAVGAASVTSLAAFHSLTVAGTIAQLIVLTRLGRNATARQQARLLASALAIPYLLLALTGTTRPTASEASLLTVLLAALAPAAAWAGIAHRARSDADQHDAARQVIADTLLEHTARGERARIARELHDVVAHHISMIAVQAETARLTTPGMPPAGARRLAAIGDTARAGLTEMRRLLGVLRDDTGHDTGRGADRAPQPGLAQLADLLDAARDSSGAATRLILHGPPAPLDPGVELAAYRIIQEALTNTRRHAPGAAIDVELHYTDDTLQLRVRDNGPGPPSATSVPGHGLLGMRERASAVGGQLHTGPAVGGGFLITAVLPAKTDPPNEHP